MLFSRKVLSTTVATACICLTTGLPAFGQPFFFKFFPHDEQEGCRRNAPLEKLSILSRFSIDLVALSSHENGRRVFQCRLDEAPISREEGENLYQVIDDEDAIQLYQNAQGLKERVGIKFFLKERGNKPCSIFYSQNFPHGHGLTLDDFRLRLGYTDQGNLQLNTSYNYLFLSLRFFKTGENVDEKEGGIIYFVNQNSLNNLPPEQRVYARTVMRRIDQKKNTYGKPVTLRMQAHGFNRVRRKGFEGFTTENVNLPALLHQCKLLEGQRLKLSHITFFDVLDQENQLLCSHLEYNAGQLARLYGKGNESKQKETMGIPINLSQTKAKPSSSRRDFAPTKALRQVLTPESNSHALAIHPSSNARSAIDAIKEGADRHRRSLQSEFDQIPLSPQQEDALNSLREGLNSLRSGPNHINLDPNSLSLQQKEAPVLWQPPVPEGFSQVQIDGHENNCLYRAFLSSIDRRWTENNITPTAELRNYLRSELEVRLSSLGPALEPQRQALRQGMAAHFLERILTATRTSDQRLIDFIRQVPHNTPHPFAQEARRLFTQASAEEALAYIRGNLQVLRAFLSETQEGQGILLAYMEDHFLNHHGEMETPETMGRILAALFDRRIIVHIAGDPAGHLYERNHFGNANHQEVHLFYTTYSGLSRERNHFNLLTPLQDNPNENGVEPERIPSSAEQAHSSPMTGAGENPRTIKQGLSYDNDSMETLSEGVTPPDSPREQKEARKEHSQPLRDKNGEQTKRAHIEYKILLKKHPLLDIVLQHKREEIFRNWNDFRKQFPHFRLDNKKKGLLAVLNAFLQESVSSNKKQQLLEWRNAEQYLKILPKSISYWVPYQIASLEDSLLSNKPNAHKEELKRILNIWKEAELYKNKLTDKQKLEIYIGISNIFRRLNQEKYQYKEFHYLKMSKEHIDLIENKKRKANLLLHFAKRALWVLKKDQNLEKWNYLKEAEKYEESLGRVSQKFLRDQLAHIGGYLFQKDPTTIDMRINLHKRALELNKNNDRARNQLELLQAEKEDQKKQRQDHKPIINQPDEKDDHSRGRNKDHKEHRSDEKDDHSRGRDKDHKERHPDKKDDRSRSGNKDHKEHRSDKKDDRSRGRDKDHKERHSEKKDDRSRSRDKEKKKHLRR